MTNSEGNSSRRGRGLGIRAKLVLVLFTLQVLMVSAVSVILIQNHRSSLRAEFAHKKQLLRAALVRKGESLARNVSMAMRDALATNELEFILQLVRTTTEHDIEVSYSLLTTHEGKVLVSTLRGQMGKKVSDPVTTRAVKTKKRIVREVKRRRVKGARGPFIEVVTPFEAGGRMYVFTLGLTTEHLQKSLALTKRRGDKELAKTRSTAIVILGISVLVAALLGLFLGSRFARPVVRLSHVVRQLGRWSDPDRQADRTDGSPGAEDPTSTFDQMHVARQLLQTRALVESSDEIGQLAASFNVMADQLVTLFHETAAKATMQKELEVARSIQKSMVPSESIVERSSLRLAGYFEPASECGGDWWTYYDLDNGKVLVLIGDVTGHGIPAAMITAVAKSAIDTLRLVADKSLTVKTVLDTLNWAILENGKKEFFMTCFASIIDPVSNAITFANAGHPFPYVYRERNGALQVEVLTSRGNRLGDVGEFTCTPETRKLQPNDVIVWYTDGIVECENPVGEEYGDKRFRNSIGQVAQLEPDAIRDQVLQSSQRFFAGTPYKDDITLVVGKVYGAPGVSAPPPPPPPPRE